MESCSIHWFGHDVRQLPFCADVEEAGFLGFDSFAQKCDAGHHMFHALGSSVGIREHYRRHVVAKYGCRDSLDWFVIEKLLHLAEVK